MPIEDGFNIFLSYHDKSSFPNSNDIIIVDKQIEYCSIDLFKLIKKEYKDKIYINSQVKYIAFDDLDINFPLIIHRGINAIEYANHTIKSIIEICKKFNEKKEDRIITFSIGIEYEQFIAIFSFISNIQILCNTENVIIFPTYKNLGQWCNQQYNFLEKNFKSEKIYEHLLDKQLNRFYLHRFFVNEFIEIDKEGIVSLKFPKEYKALAEAINNGSLKVIPVLKIEKGICTKCHQDYAECNCSVFLDKDCNVTIEKGEPIGFIASTRIA